MGEGDVTKEQEPETFSEVLGDAVGALEEAGVPYLVFGSIASSIYGRPGRTGDIDLLLRPEDGRRALRALTPRGFETDETDPAWLFKATKRGVLVDLIFRVKGDVYLDDEMVDHAVNARFAGQSIQMVAPEDAVVIEAASTEIQAPEHWFNGLAIVTGTPMDWDYLRHRAQHSVRRVLSLLVYAESSDAVLPPDAVYAMLEKAYPGLRRSRVG
jgi:predicted nucleotidyltransferase